MTALLREVRTPDRGSTVADTEITGVFPDLPGIPGCGGVP
jgi:hypothetical protein